MDDKPDSIFTLVDPQKIDFDKGNPRGEVKEHIEADPEFKKLISSVKEFDILVPLIVKNNTNKERPYKLVDGERRLRAAISVGKKSVPVRIINDDETEAKILAYQIHMIRKQWEKPSELQSIKEIRNELIKSNKDMSEAELLKKLCDITGHKDHEIKDLLILLKYNENAIEKVQNEKVAMSHLIQGDSSFITPIKREFPDLYERYGDEKLRDIIVKKAENGKLGNTRYLMDNVLKFFRNKSKAAEFKAAIKEFLDKPDQDIKQVIDKMQPKPATTTKNTTSTTATTPAQSSKKGTTGPEAPTQINHKAKLEASEKKIIGDGVFDLLFHNLREAIMEFEKRTKRKFNNERELQDFIYSTLRSLFVSVEFEDPTEKICGKSNRFDFVIKDHKIIVEVKYVRDENHTKTISEELSCDYLRYAQSPYGKTRINYIYDPNKHITNQELFVKELKKIMPEGQHYIQ